MATTTERASLDDKVGQAARSVRNQAAEPVLKFQTAGNVIE